MRLDLEERAFMLPTLEFKHAFLFNLKGPA